MTVVGLLLLIKAKSNCDVCEFSSFTSSVNPETLNELLLQWDFNQPMATKVVAFFYCIMSCTIGTELSFWPSTCHVCCRWVNQFDASTQLIWQRMRERLSYSFPPHSNNCVHSSESEITNCQSLHIPCSTCGLDRTTSDVLKHLFLRHGLVQVATL